MSKEIKCAQCDQVQTKESIRFVCLVCDNYEHCEQCHTKKHWSGNHRPYHPMQRVLPLNQMLKADKLVVRKKFLRCPYCSDEGFHEYGLHKHVEEFHKTIWDRIRCPVCVAFNVNQANRIGNFIDHFKSNHFRTLYVNCSICYASISSFYECMECVHFGICHDCFSQKRIGQNHKLFHPMQFCHGVAEFIQLLQNNASDFGSIQVFCCPYCGDRNFKVAELIKHCQESHRDLESQSVRCPVCILLRAPSSPLKGSLLEHLLELHTIGSDTLECSICIEKIGTNVKTLRCGHGFHPSCVADWLRGHTTCPVCRAEHRE